MNRLIRFPMLAGLFALAVGAGAAPLSTGGGLTGFSLATSDTANRQSSQLPIDSIAAVVNGEVILKSRLAHAVARARQRIGSNMPRDVLRSRVLDRLIMRKLQLQKAHKSGISMSEQALQRGMRRLARQNNMTLDQFKGAVRQRGISIKALKAQVRKKMLINRVHRQSLMSKVFISANEVDQYLQTQNLQQGIQSVYRFRRIIMSASPDDGSMREQLERIVRQARNGADFASLARKNSDGPAEDQGGLVDWTRASELPTRISETLDGLDEGEVSGVIQNGDRLIIVKLLGRRPAGVPNQGAVVTQVKVRHIMLQPNAIRSEQQTKAQARRLRRQIEAGASFSALAKQYSDDEATADGGGALGWITVGDVNPKTRRTLAKLEPGEVSSVLSTANGFEIIKLEKRRTRNQAEQQRRNKARRVLARKRAQERNKAWMHQLRNRAYVDIRIDDYRPAAGT